jgi:hypothetical protein
MTAVSLRLGGLTDLAGALASAARRRGVPLVAERAETGRPILTCWRADHCTASVAVSAGWELAAAIVDNAVRRVVAGLSLVAEHATVVALAPAAGVGGPAERGPVDAIRDAGVWTATFTEISVFGRLLAVQHTRCWLVNCVFSGISAGPELGARVDVELLPEFVGQDTARIAEFMHDRGFGEDWSQIALLGRLRPGPADDLSVLFACTEAGYASELVGTVLDGDRR